MRDPLAASRAVLDGCGDELLRACQCLTDKERAIILLRSIGELSCAEIADVLNVPLGTASGPSVSRPRQAESYARWLRALKGNPGPKEARVNCLDARLLVESWLDEPPIGLTRSALQLHLDSCHHCSALMRERELVEVQFQRQLGAATERDEQTWSRALAVGHTPAPSAAIWIHGNDRACLVRRSGYRRPSSISPTRSGTLATRPRVD